VQEVVVSKIVDQIIEAQSLVAKAEAGEIEWGVAFSAAFDQGHLDPNDLYNFVAGMYARFRITEAGAHKFQKGNEGYPSTGVRNLVTTCDILKADIHEVLRNSESYEPTTAAEEIAKLWIEEKCRWALSRLEQFTAWGY